MSQASLKKFLIKLDAEMSRSSEDYRRAVTNKKITTFTYRSSTIRKTLKILLDNATNIDGGKAEATLKHKELTKALRTLTSNIRTSFSLLAGSSNGTIQLKNIRGGLIATLEETAGRDNFGAVQRAYKKHLDAFYETFIEILGTPILRKSTSNASGLVEVDTSGKAFNLEHVEKSSNVEFFLNDAIYNSLEEVYGEEAKVSDIQEELAKLKLNDIIKIVKNVEDGSVQLLLGSQILNVAQSKKEQAVKRRLEAKLRQALERLDVPNLSGSDSLISGTRKKAVKNIMKPFVSLDKKNKNVKTSVEDTLIKESAPEILKIKSEVTRVRKARKRLSRKKSLGYSRNKSVASMPLMALMANINKQLPNILAKNMESPALEYQTGRFASGVRVTDIVRTPKGFPSIGYTYDKYPYQTFELGYRQGDPDRDPRKLIDRSIREIAAQYAIGRFYTRRV